MALIGSGGQRHALAGSKINVTRGLYVSVGLGLDPTTARVIEMTPLYNPGLACLAPVELRVPTCDRGRRLSKGKSGSSVVGCDVKMASYCVTARQNPVYTESKFGKILQCPLVSVNSI